MDRTNRRSFSVIALAAMFTAAVVALGYVLLGFIPMVLFALGFVGGLLFWILTPTEVPFAVIRVPYFLGLALFVLHKLEERYLDFFPALSRLTGVPVPEGGSSLAMLLYAFAGMWLLIPWLVGRGLAFGYFLAWTFFASMGITELAHFAFPVFTGGPYGYFPGMASVLPLAPIAWWGMWRLAFGRDFMRDRAA
ncbi:MAG: hypothetical protein F9K19_21190 [Rhizobiaceae bacterium]|nr:MAG: hypothetical protein F9K19_21190 [Rhizobiaceae bacterium]CAG0983538.1 hypothetical protein RHIZO_01866 [Rhizobiaceae bacterium]